MRKSSSDTKKGVKVTAKEMEVISLLRNWVWADFAVFVQNRWALYTLVHRINTRF